MLSDRENRRLHEIEMQLRLTDPGLVRRFAELESRTRRARTGLADLLGGGRGDRSVHGAGPLPTVLLVLALVVLLAGAVAVSVPVVVAGIVFAVLALGLAATGGPQAGPRTA